MSSMDRESSSNLGSLLVDANFAERSGNLPKDYLGDWVAELKALNKKRINECDEFGETYITRETVEYIFTLCIRLRMPIEVRFMAVSIFDRFMRLHAKSLIDFLGNLDMDNKQKRIEWENVETNMSRQLTLRICTAIQIASKNVSYHDSLSSIQICKCLRALGTPYTKAVVFKSELRVLKMLDYKIPHTQVVYAESILKLFSMTKRPDMDANSVWNFMCILMDLTLMEREKIYDNMIMSMDDDPSKMTETGKNRLKADWILLSCAVICAASCCEYGVKTGDPVSEELEEMCKIPSKDISNLAVAILEVARGTDRGVKEETDRVTPPHAKRIAIARSRSTRRDGSIPFRLPILPVPRGRIGVPARDL